MCCVTHSRSVEISLLLSLKTIIFRRSNRSSCQSDSSLHCWRIHLHCHSPRDPRAAGGRLLQAERAGGDGHVGRGGDDGDHCSVRVRRVGEML